MRHTFKVKGLKKLYQSCGLVFSWLSCSHIAASRDMTGEFLRCPVGESPVRTTDLSSSLWKDPIGTDEMAGVSVGNAFQVILVFRLCLPKFIHWNNFGHNLAGPQA
jgi:hypothetical protein